MRLICELFYVTILAGGNIVKPNSVGILLVHRAKKWSPSQDFKGPSMKNLCKWHNGAQKIRHWDDQNVMTEGSS